MPPQPQFVRLAAGSLVNLEDPEHSRLRKLVNQAFSPAIVQRMEPRIAAIVDELIERVCPRRRVSRSWSGRRRFPSTVSRSCR